MKGFEKLVRKLVRSQSTKIKKARKIKGFKEVIEKYEIRNRRITKRGKKYII